MKKIFCLLFISCSAIAQQKDLIDTALQPFWKGKVMYNESVLMISKDGKPAEASLLFKPKKIISVQNSGLNIEYKKNIDWKYKNGKLTLLPGSKAVFMNYAELYPDSTKKSFPAKNGGRVLHQEGIFFHEHQLAVTYKHAKHKWKGPIPVFKENDLPKTLDKLQNKKPVRLLLFGDSIAEGYNASGKFNKAPNLPDWGELINEKLKRFYDTPITFINTAIAGKDSKWGRETVQQNVIAHQPDLVIIAFGMNDGTGKVSPQQFKANIQGIIQKIKGNNGNAEFILIAPMLPNPESFFTGTQPEFKAVLDELIAKGIVVVDMTETHRELLKYKSYQDMTGNNINHPNDFLMRWYAQEILGLLVP